MDFLKQAGQVYWRWTSGGGKWRYAVGIGLPLVLAISIISGLGGNGADSGDSTTTAVQAAEAVSPTPDLFSVDPDRSLSACVVARKFVEERLKAPSTAKFPPCRDVTVSRNGETWTLTSHVDAQNSFGAMLRNNYQVIMTYKGKVNGDDTFSLVSLDLEQ